LPAQPEAPPPDPAPADYAAGELRLPAQASELHRAREYADRAAANFGLHESERFEFVYAVNEAVTNAIRHGTADEAGTIGLRILVEDDRLMLEVRDRGPFVTARVENESLLDHGRGFALMAKLVDDVAVQAGPTGTSVRLAKRRRGRLNGVGVDRG